MNYIITITRNSKNGNLIIPIRMTNIIISDKESGYLVGIINFIKKFF